MMFNNEYINEASFDFFNSSSEEQNEFFNSNIFNQQALQENDEDFLGNVDLNALDLKQEPLEEPSILDPQEQVSSFVPQMFDHHQLNQPHQQIYVQPQPQAHYQQYFAPANHQYMLPHQSQQFCQVPPIQSSSSGSFFSFQQQQHIQQSVYPTQPQLAVSPDSTPVHYHAPQFVQEQVVSATSFLQQPAYHNAYPQQDQAYANILVQQLQQVQQQIASMNHHQQHQRTSPVEQKQLIPSGNQSGQTLNFVLRALQKKRTMMKSTAGGARKRERETSMDRDSANEDCESSLEADEKKMEKKIKKEAALLEANRESTNATSSNIMQIIDGFTTAPQQKQCGGKDNKEPVAPHTVRINLKELSKLLDANNETFDRSKIMVRAHLIGYKKMSKNKLQLAILQHTFISLEKSLDEVEVKFENMICKHSSHNCGQKLFIKFSIMDATDKKHPRELHSIKSAEFETITKRGVEKQRQKQKMKAVSSAEASPVQQGQEQQESMFDMSNSFVWNPPANLTLAL